MMRRRIDEFNQANPAEKVFRIEYIDFNFSIEQFRRSLGLRGDSPQAMQEVVNRWKLSDHLDNIFSLGITKLVDDLLDSGKKNYALPRKQILDLFILTALYYNSDRRATTEARTKLCKLFNYIRFRPAMRWMVWIILTLLSVEIGLLPMMKNWTAGPARYWYAAGGIGLLLTWGWALLSRSSLHNMAARAHHSVKVLPRDSNPLIQILTDLSPKERKEFVLPRASDEATRYHVLHRFLGLLDMFGYKGVYVLIDRIDEPSLLSGKEELMRQFVEKILDIKLLQYSGLGIKLFLPIELDEIHRNASPEQLKRMRLDKSNLIAELKWSGQELYEIANQRFLAGLSTNAAFHHLSELFEDKFDFNYLRDTLTTLGTPRHAFGFLSTLFTEYVKDLPNDLPENDPRWKVPRSHFDIVRASWIDRSGVMRRTLN